MTSRRLRSSGLDSFSPAHEDAHADDLPRDAGGTRKEASWTSSAFLRDTLRSRSSGGELLLALGVTFPTRMSLAPRSWKDEMPCSSRASRASPHVGMSRVISSAPSFVSRRLHSNSVMWMDVKISS